MTPTNFEGVFPILATPFHDDETLDLDSLDRLVRFMVGLGVDGVTVLGVLGEANRLTDTERDEVIRTAVAAAGGSPVIVGTSHSGTYAACGLSMTAERLGASAVMVAPQAEAVPNEERILEHYRAIGGAIGIPVVMQDHPASTQVHMSVALILRVLREVPRVAAIKQEAVPTAPKIRAILSGMTEKKVPILTGLGALYGLFDLEAGSSGFNTGFAFPEVLMAIVAEARQREWDRVRALYTRFLPLIVLEQQPGVAIRKEILKLRGLIGSARVRHPGGAIPQETRLQLTTLLSSVLPGADLSRPIRLSEQALQKL